MNIHTATIKVDITDEDWGRLSKEQHVTLSNEVASMVKLEQICIESNLENHFAWVVNIPLSDGVEVTID